MVPMRRIANFTNHLLPKHRLPTGYHGLNHNTYTGKQLYSNVVSKQDDRNSFRYFLPIQTRWKDNDMYGHVNNVVYYEFFDTVINHWLIHHGGLDTKGHAIGLCVNSSCDFKAPLEYPEVVEAGLRINFIGKSSVQYQVGIFSEKDSILAATGTFTHVFVDGKSRKPSAIPDAMRSAMENELLVKG